MSFKISSSLILSVDHCQSTSLRFILMRMFWEMMRKQSSRTLKPLFILLRQLLETRKRKTSCHVLNILCHFVGSFSYSLIDENWDYTVKSDITTGYGHMIAHNRTHLQYTHFHSKNDEVFDNFCIVKTTQDESALSLQYPLWFALYCKNSFVIIIIIWKWWMKEEIFPKMSFLY